VTVFGLEQHPAGDPLGQLRNRLRRLHRLSGEPSVRVLSKRTGHAITHTTVHAVLRCERTPKWGPLELVIEALGGKVDEFRNLWVAVRDAEDARGLGAAATVNPLPDWGNLDRIAAGVSGIVRPDALMHGHLVQELQDLRLTEDERGAGAVLDAALRHVPEVAALRSAAAGGLHEDLLSLEAQWAQFCGWLYQDLGNHPASEQWYAEALARGHEAGDNDMVASVLSMRANAAWGFGNAERCITLSAASLRITTASAGVRALSAQQLARGYALVGDRKACERTLEDAVGLSAKAATEPEQVAPWLYYQTPTRLEIQRAMCYRDLGLYGTAIGMLRMAIAELPGTYRRDRGQYLARLAVTLKEAGEAEEATVVAAQARALATETGSARAMLELDRLSQ
jgi:tetratricopeptide (TPR) repeat protein